MDLYRLHTQEYESTSICYITTMWVTHECIPINNPLTGYFYFLLTKRGQHTCKNWFTAIITHPELWTWHAQPGLVIFGAGDDGWLLHVKPRNNNKTVLLCKKHGFHCLASWVTGSAQVTIWPRKTCSGASSFDPILPEGHREPHGHHHVGGAAVLGGENSLEITPYLEEQTRGYRHRGETHRERNNKYTVH